MKRYSAKQIVIMIAVTGSLVACANSKDAANNAPPVASESVSAASSPNFQTESASSSAGLNCPNMQVAWNDINTAQMELEQVHAVGQNGVNYNVDSTDLNLAASQIGKALNSIALAESAYGCLGTNAVTDAVTSDVKCPHRAKMLSSLNNAIARLQNRNLSGIYVGYGKKAVDASKIAMTVVQSDFTQLGCD